MMGLSGKEKRQPYMGCAPPPTPSAIGPRRGGRPPLSLPPLKESYSNKDWGGGNPTPRGSRTLLARLLWPASLPPLVLYILRQRHPRTHKLIHVIYSLAVCGAPSHHIPR